MHALLEPGMKVTIAVDDISLPLPPMKRPDIRERVLAYTPSNGTRDFLAVLQGYYAGLGHTLALDQILVTTGGSEAVEFALFATLILRIIFISDHQRLLHNQ